MNDKEIKSITEIRRENINKGRLKSNETNKIKGCISYIEKKKKQDEYKAKLEMRIKENKKIYDDIYRRYQQALSELDNIEETEGLESKTEQDIYLKYLSLKELDILIYFDMKDPDDI